MGNHVYTRKTTETCKLLKIHSSKIKHIRRNTAPVIMDMVEVDGFYQRNIGNWSNDVFADVYSINLPLGVMRALSGVNKRRGYYKNPRTIFKGDRTHESLASKMFPWVEGVRGTSISQISIILMNS